MSSFTRSPNEYQSRLTKALIYKHDKNGRINREDPIRVLFNPNSYSIDKSNHFANMSIPGRQSPLLQFIKGDSEILTLELFFDTYTYYLSEDVRTYTNKIMNLLKIDGEIHAPPICSFVWGKHGIDKPYFTGVIEHATITYTMFIEDGTPVRAKLNLTLRQFQQPDKTNTRLSSPDKTKRWLVKGSDSLWSIASKEFGDPAKWRDIASANKIVNPLSLKVGSEIIIPKLDN